MSEKKEKPVTKPVTIIIKIVIPTKEVILSAVEKLFPFSDLYGIKISIEEEKKEETQSEQPKA